MKLKVAKLGHGLGILVLSLAISLPMQGQNSQQDTNSEPAAAPGDKTPPSQDKCSTPQDNLPSAPSSSQTTEPSLGDLGFPSAQTQSNPEEQARLDKRTHMLKIHQRMGLITTVPLLATLLTSLNAGGKNTSSTSRDVHAALGGVTADLYFITAYYAIRAPRIPGTETKGPIRRTQSSGLDSWAGHDPDADFGDHGIQSTKQWREGSWARISACAGGDHYGGSVWGGSSIGLAKVLANL